MALSVTGRPPATRLSDAVVEQHVDPAHRDHDGMMLITTSPALRTAYVEAATTMEEPLADSANAAGASSAGSRGDPGGQLPASP